jgi:hypothetical protein
VYVIVTVVAGPPLFPVRGQVPTIAGGGTAIEGEIVTPAGAVMENASVPPAVVACAGVLVQAELNGGPGGAKTLQRPAVLLGAAVPELVFVTTMLIGI